MRGYHTSGLRRPGNKERPWKALDPAKGWTFAENGEQWAEWYREGNIWPGVRVGVGKSLTEEVTIHWGLREELFPVERAGKTIQEKKNIKALEYVAAGYVWREEVERWTESMLGGCWLLW